MVQMFRTNPALIIQTALLVACLVVCALGGLLLSRAGASLRPVGWMAGLFILVIGPQIAASLYLSAGASKASEPRNADLEDLAADRSPEIRQSAVKRLFGPDLEGLPVTDARQMFGDAFVDAESAQFAALPNGDSVLLARFKGTFAAEKGWIAYLRVTGLNQLKGEGDSQRGYVVTRPGGDRAYVLHFQNMVGVWTGKDDAAIRQRLAAGGFEIPRRAPLAGVSQVTDKPSNSVSAGLAAAFIALNVLVVVLYFFKGAAWAGSSPALAGVPAVNATELAARLEAINALDVPFRIERGSQPDEFFATWRYADAKWIDHAHIHGLRRTFRIRLLLDEKHGTVRATDYAANYDWSAGRGGANIEWKANMGIVFFQFEQQRVFGLQLDEQGRFKPELSYSYKFNLDEMKSPLIAAVTRAGWTWRPTIWQGPVWLRWLTE